MFMIRCALGFAIAIVAAAGCNEVVVPGQSGCLLDGDCTIDEICRDGTCVSSTLPPAPDGGLGGCTPENEAEICGVGAFCNVDGRCATLPDCEQGCPNGFVCNALNVCVRETPCGPNCPDNLFCNGLERCDTGSGECLPGEPPCGEQACSEESRDCLCAGDGDCDPGETCDIGTGACSCTPDCGTDVCGDDGCGGSCGTCEGANDSCVNGQCVCTPDCNGRECGDDGCGNECGPGCGFANDVCVDGQCQCTPDCDGRECGDDGCGNECAPGCGGGETCSPNGLCDCVPDCTNKQCGDDGCGNECAPGCTGGDVCNGIGICEACTPQCTGLECGPDGCGGNCGVCHPSQSCTTGDCTNTGDDCAALTDLLSLNEFDDFPGLLNANDEEYEWDGFPFRILDDYDLEVPAPDLNDGTVASAPVPLIVTVESTDFSPKLYIYRLDTGCELIGETNNIADFVGLEGALDPAGSYKAVVTSRSELASGSYTINTFPRICDQLFENEDAYNKCEARVRASNFTCSNNPCVDFGNSAEFCCVRQDNSFCLAQNPSSADIIHVENDNFCLGN
jgi:hypothetical protein